MPINKYRDRDLNKLRELVSIDSAMFIPNLDDIFGIDKLVEGDRLQCNYGIPVFADVGGMHSTLAMHLDLDQAKRLEVGVSMLYMPHEHISICLPRRDPNILDDFKERPYLYIDSFTHDDEYDTDNGLLGRAGLFPDSDHWSTPICRYDEDKIKAYTFPSKDRLEMLVRINKLIKGSK